MSRRSSTCKECMLKTGECGPLLFQFKQIKQTSKEDAILLGNHILDSSLVEKYSNSYHILQKKGNRKHLIYPTYTNNTMQLSHKQGLVAGYCYRNSTYFPLGNLNPHKFSPFKATEKQYAAYALVSFPSCWDWHSTNWVSVYFPFYLKTTEYLDQHPFFH